jgi:hypothetical protein
MTVKFIEPNIYISLEMLGQEIEAHLQHDPVFGVQFGFYPGGVWVYLSRVDQMPFFVKGTEKEIETLKEIGFGVGDGMWGVYS